MEVPLHSPLGLDSYLDGFSFWAMAHVLVYCSNFLWGFRLNVVTGYFWRRGVPRIVEVVFKTPRLHCYTICA